MKFLALLLAGALSVLPAVTASAEESATPPEEGSIEWITQGFLKQKDFPERQRYYTGDMRLYGSRQTPGATFADPKYELDIRVNERDETSAAVAAAVIDSTSNKQTDFYLFFRRDDQGWKLSAVRNFAPPRGMGQMYAALAAKGQDVDARDMRELAILKVLQYNDWGMKQVFTQRREAFDAIAEELMKRGITEVIHGGQPNARAGKELSEKVRDAALNYVQLHETGLIEFNAAAFGESAAGYLWVHPSSEPPAASPEDYILVEPLDGPWYLYRRQ